MLNGFPVIWGKSWRVPHVGQEIIDTLCSGLCEILRFSVQRIYSGFEVIEAGIFFTETSDYFSEILWSSYRPCSQICSHMFNGLFTNYDISLVSSYLGLIVTCAACGAGNAHSFRNTWFHSFWGVHDFTHSLYIHYIWLNLSVLGLCLRIWLSAWIGLAALSRTYFILWDWTNDFEQCLNRLQCNLMLYLMNFSCGLGIIMARYDFPNSICDFYKLLNRLALDII